MIGSISIVILGYINQRESYIIRLSFGNLWGDHGYAYIPYNYIQNMGMDLWCIDIIIKENIILVENNEIDLSIQNKYINNEITNHKIQNRYI